MLSMLLLAAMVQAPQEGPIERPGRVAVDPSRTTQLYDVRDLLEPLLAIAADAPESLAELGYVDDDAAERRRLEQGIRRYLNEQEMIRAPTLDPTFRKERILRAETQSMGEFLSKFVDPPLRRTQGRLEVAAPGTLSLSGTPEQHAWLQSLLERHRREREWVDLSARFFRAPAGTLASLGISPGAVAESPGDVAALESKLADARFEKAVAPRLRKFLLSRSEIRVEDEISYIQEWEFTTVEPGRQRIADPKIGRVFEGHSLAARVASLEPGIYALSAEVEKSEVVRPIRTSKVVDSESGSELEIALPEVRRARITSDMKLRDGAAAVLILTIDAEHELAVLIQIARAEAADSAPKEHEDRQRSRR